MEAPKSRRVRDVLPSMKPSFLFVALVFFMMNESYASSNILYKRSWARRRIQKLITKNYPVFTQVPPNLVTPTEGTNLQQSCQAKGFPAPVLNWTRVKQPLPVGRTEVEQGNLAIRNLSAVDSGLYECVASNSRGTTTHRMNVLVVQKEPPPCGPPLDMVFLIDSSGSIGTLNYEKVKDLVKAVAMSVGLAPGGNRAAIVLYSTSASIMARFGEFATTVKFQQAVDRLPHERGLTRIDLALLKAGNVIPSARPGAAKFALLITDGRQTAAADAINLKQASKPLRKAGVHVMAVGIGRGVDEDELSSITEDVNIFKDFDDVLLQLSNLTSKVCESAAKSKLKGIEEPVRPSGESTSVPRAKMSPAEQTRNEKGSATFYCFSGGNPKPTVEWRFKGEKLYSGSKYFVTEDQLEIRQLDYTDAGQYTCVAESLLGSAESSGNLSVRGVPVFTQVPPSLVTPTEGTNLQQSCQAKGFPAPVLNWTRVMQSLPVGRTEVEQGNLAIRNLSAVDSGLYECVATNSMGSTSYRMSVLVVQKEPPPCGSPADVVFLIDSSGSIGSRNYEKEKVFVKALAKRFGIAPGQSRGGIVLYSTSASVKAQLGEFATTAKFQGVVDQLDYEWGLSLYYKALAKAADVFSLLDLPGENKIALLFTDGPPTRLADAKKKEKEASEALRKAGVHVIVLGIGPRLDKNRLRSITDADEDVIMIENFNTMLLQLNNLISKVCELADKKHGPHDGIQGLAGKRTNQDQ